MLILIIAKKKCLTVFGMIPVPEAYLPVKLAKYKLLISRIHVALMFALLVSNHISLQYFLLFGMNTSADRLVSILAILYVSLAIIIYTILIWNTSELVQFMNDLEKLMTKS